MRQLLLLAVLLLASCGTTSQNETATDELADKPATETSAPAPGVAPTPDPAPVAVEAGNPCTYLTPQMVQETLGLSAPPAPQEPIVGMKGRHKKLKY